MGQAYSLLRILFNQYSIKEEERMTTIILELQGHTEQNFSFYQGTGFFDPSKVAYIKSPLPRFGNWSAHNNFNLNCVALKLKFRSI
jgi:hypothetical protein